MIRLARNSGQTAALACGFQHTHGNVVVAIDADGENDPADIPVLLAKLDEGYDLVSGWRTERWRDCWIHPSAALDHCEYADLTHHRREAA